MRVALFTPLPPAKTGTADYAAALIPHLASGGSIDVIEQPSFWLNPSKYDLLVYEIANNAHHADIYKVALKHPGIVVLHETNLHHLIQKLTLGAGHHQDYIREVEHEIFGHEKLTHFKNDSFTVPQGRHFTMLRRLLEQSLACIVHSRWAASDVLRRGFEGPVHVIPHGAATRQAQTARCKQALGLQVGPVIGIFGYQRRDKRILECLEMFRALEESLPGIQLLIVGEPHPEVQVERSLSELDLARCTRVVGYQPRLQDFEQYMEACDVILNLRWPCYGETSGIMMRAFGLGKVVIVNDEGACRELPEGVSVKIPQDVYQWDVARECLRWLCTDAEATQTIGQRAQEWVREECAWERAADLHWQFFRHVIERRRASPLTSKSAYHAATAQPAGGSTMTPESVQRYLLRWIDPQAEGGRYCLQHLTRLVRMLLLTPSGSTRESVLEMGCYLQITPALRDLLGYGNVRGCYLGQGESERRQITARDGHLFDCAIDLFDAESETFPYQDDSFTTVICGELLEHLQKDPIHMFREIHRILKPGGYLLLTTPNIASLRSVAAVLRGSHPGYFSYYMNPFGENASHARHHREYTPVEVYQLFAESGFTVERLETTSYFDETGKHSCPQVEAVLEGHGFPTTLRGDCILTLGRKDGSPAARLPSWLYM